jgi:UDP-N-acetylmuramoyl-L-alanyl-D-glutamate--2,6-diaminopimelate ligase
VERTWQLGQLLEGIASVAPQDDRPVGGLAMDSRVIRAGEVFVAFPGVAADGRRFIADAVARGAAAVLYEADGVEAPAAGVPCLAIAGLRRELGRIADRFYGSPSQRLKVIGVTGTNGKTTCTQLLAQALDQSGSRESALGSSPSPAGGGNEGGGGITATGRCGIIGTLGYGFPGKLDASLHTTPDALTVHRLLAEFVRAGAGYTAMEVSSHALDQGRVNAVTFEIAVFTNLTHDHLDYHGDMAAYGAAKASLFSAPGVRHVVINRDDPFGRELLGGLGKNMRVTTYGLEGGGVTARSLKLTHRGMALRVDSPAGRVAFTSPLFGRFNAYNLLAAFATLLALGLSAQEAAHRLSAAQPAAGRMERFGGEKGAPLVVVDYAHTPDALEQALAALREHTDGKLICVFGCGGDRDRAKRPLMGAIAERLADRVYLTDDNPRTEDPEAIVADIRAGMSGEAHVIRNRPQAIAHALAGAGDKDIVLVAGKGHEGCQQVGSERLPYSDRDTVRALLARVA